MKTSFSRHPALLAWIAAFFVLCPIGPAARAVELRQVISREHPAIQGIGQRLAVGRDGFVYVFGGREGKGYVLRVARDGGEKFGFETVYATTGAAANADGVVATSNAHFAKSVNTYDRRGNALGQAPGFTGNDAVGWDGPGAIEVGASGDFYALDQHANRVVRVSPEGRITRSYPLRHESEPDWGRLWSYGFRVCEPREQFYYVAGGKLHCVGFDGRARWAIDTQVAGDPWGGFSGGFDVADDGTLLVVPAQEPIVRAYDEHGEPAGEITLESPPDAPGPGPRISHMRVFGDDLITRRDSETEIFQVHDRASGRFRRAVGIAHEMLTVRFDEPVWIAGAATPLAIEFQASDQRIQPDIKAWIRPLGTVEFAPLPLTQGRVTPPAEETGLFHVRVTAGLAGAESEYQVQTVVEVRPPDAQGSISIFTPLNRLYYARGEPIPFSVACRAPEGQAVPDRIEVQLVNDASDIVRAFTIDNQGGSRDALSAGITPEETRGLPAGQYRLTARVPGWTVAAQHLTIGSGGEPWQAHGQSPDGRPGVVRTHPFSITQHGDYYAAYPTVDYWNAPEYIARHLAASGRLGINTFVDRLGHSGQGGLNELTSTVRDADLAARLAGDPLAVAPQKAEFATRAPRTIAGYGAHGIEQRAILLYMDAGLPVGTGFDQRPPKQLEADVALVTRALADHPAFRGWSWAANWWIDKRGAAAARDDAQRVEYEAALKSAQETGTWSPVLDDVSDRWVNLAAEAERQFRAVLEREAIAASGQSGAGREGVREPLRLISAMTGPYRQPGMIPGVTFAGTDEVDLHFQSEQIQWPMISAHNVDFYKRPGKRAWGHPELWNDDGTGGQILSNQLQMVMRGADGVGQSGSTKGFTSLPSDPRGMGPGATSIHRELNGWLGEHGAWLASAEAADPLAIPVSTRMLRMELGWQGVGGFYFTRLFEAHNACLRAHRPASFVFAEDCGPDTLRRYKGVLVVSQTVEFEPSLAAALDEAAAAGVPIYADKSCHDGIVANARPLDVEFTRVERDPHVLNDDSAFWRFRDYMLEHAAALSKALGDTVPPVAGCQHPEVLLTERRLGDIRVLWAVNDAAVPLEPGHLWRVSLAAGSRLPVSTSLSWNVGSTHEVFELFSGRAMDATAPLPLDLRAAPARVFVAVPRDAERSTWPATLRKVLETPAIDERFAARLRDIAVSPSGDAALVTAAGWDGNLFLVDPRDGSVRARDRAGHHFAYGPQATSRGFAVQGYDLNTAEGYHLYLTDAAAGGGFERRFALYGLPQRGVGWSNARQWTDAVNNFAVAPDGSWVAASGGLGLAVWSRDGTRRWSDDWWRDDRREVVRLLAADAGTLITLRGPVVSARDASSGSLLWEHELGPTGQLTAAAVSADGRVLALRSTAEGGRVFIVRDGSPARELPAALDELALSPDGARLAVTDGNRLKLFDTAGGMRWSFTADEVLRSPRFSPDGDRIAVGSELGTLYVLNAAGERLAEQDLGALPIAAWLPDGDLLAATWLGRLTRLDGQYQPRWTTTLLPEGAIDPADLLAADRTPTTRIDDWGNAADEPAGLADNLLSQTPALVEAWCDPPTHGDPRAWHHPVDLLRDGQSTPPDEPWLEWTDISYLDSGWRSKLVVQVDTFRAQVRLRGVTLVEDPRHPQSWVRDARLQWWDAAAETWRDGPYLLSDRATHTHWFEQPIEAAKFRLVSPGGGSWPVGNLRWGELVFHGEVLGPSHPDAVANRAVAVLFDEREDDLKHLMAFGNRPFAFKYDDAHSGGKSLSLTAAGETTANWRPPFGHVLPNWDFQIVEHPTRPGEYRWLQFAWKALSPETTGITLRVGPHHGGGVAVSAGQATPIESAVAVTQGVEPPADWQVVRVDLWKLAGGDFTIRSLSLGAVGGGAAFDHILLGRDEGDFAGTGPVEGGE